jgi:hypothetical protein
MRQNYIRGRDKQKTALPIVCFDWQVDASVTIAIHQSPATALALISAIPVRNRRIVFDSSTQNRLELSLFH